jgi:hypothetical protein
VVTILNLTVVEGQVSLWPDHPVGKWAYLKAIMCQKASKVKCRATRVGIPEGRDHLLGPIIPPTNPVFVQGSDGKFCTWGGEEGGMTQELLASWLPSGNTLLRVWEME